MITCRTWSPFIFFVVYLQSISHVRYGPSRTCPTRWKFTHKFLLLLRVWPLNYERDVSRIEGLINFYTAVRLKCVSVRITFRDEVGHTRAHTDTRCEPKVNLSVLVSWVVTRWVPVFRRNIPPPSLGLKMLSTTPYIMLIIEGAGLLSFKVYGDVVGN